MRLEKLSSLLLLLIAAGCTQSTDVGAEAVSYRGTVPSGTPVEYVPAVPLTEFGRCLSEGGSLALVDSIDNNDTRDHGEILAFDVSPERRIAVSSADGTLKFWSLDEFVGEVGLNMISYGPELEVRALNLAFAGERVVSGDSRGAVLRWDASGSMDIVGGTAPGTPIDALALDTGRGLVAHASEGELVVRPLPDAEGETIMVTATGITDLLFAHDHLYVLTDEALQVRDITTLDIEMDVAIEGGQHLRVAGEKVAVATSEGVSVMNQSLAPVSEHPAEGLRDALVIDGLPLIATQQGADARIDIDGATLTIPGEEAVALALDPQGELAFIAMAGGQLHLIACAP